MISVLVAEDQHVVRAALVSLLGRQLGIEVVADVASGADVCAAALRHRPDVAVLDLGLPEVDGLTAALRLREALPACRPLILTGMDRPGHVHRALSAGIPGFLLKTATAEELTGAIRTVAAGGRVIGEGLAEASWEPGVCPLTEREAQVLALAATGAAPREIAAELFLSLGRVRNCLSSATGKLCARTLVDAVRIAERNGWI
ncbi:MerR family transcriptional regulator [Streptomyces caatingaensis]|uniref:MerR family transcriptional regulator n=1 Tax=Streptomyces caatingaensis TaxID=1678637 RepID=A0A0K9XIR4_9ACTN|nr:response regulator transcription factor [Streptomyces caatingaensis]KNB52567.1 MerR family transcriptional regulator [Streptomyces caatingaensis]